MVLVCHDPISVSPHEPDRETEVEVGDPAVRIRPLTPHERRRERGVSAPVVTFNSTISKAMGSGAHEKNRSQVRL